jgi:aconitate hydratase
MGVLPLQFGDGESATNLGLDGTESFDISGIDNGAASQVKVTATKADGTSTTFEARVRIDTPKERDYYRNGGILHYVLRQLAA